MGSTTMDINTTLAYGKDNRTRPYFYAYQVRRRDITFKTRLGELAPVSRGGSLDKSLHLVDEYST